MEPYYRQSLSLFRKMAPYHFHFLAFPKKQAAILSIEFLSDAPNEQELTIETGSLPIPPPNIEPIPYTQENMGYMMGTIFGPAERLVILNHAGQVVWQTRQGTAKHMEESILGSL